MTLKEMIFKCLKDNANTKFTARQIAEYIVKNFPDETERKKNNSKNKNLDIIDQYSCEIPIQRDDLLKNYPNIKSTDERPKKFYYTDLSEKEEIKELEETKKEIDLYPVFIELLKNKALFGKRIDEKTGTNRNGNGGNKWLYPDIVAVESLIENWEDKTKTFANECLTQKIKIYSYEIKTKINMSNVRECYFQAVSNSTWANLGYLVTQEINEDAKNELKILSSLYGIGLIILDLNENDFYIDIPAKERENLDFNIVNRLIKENKDFRDFIGGVSDFCKTTSITILKNMNNK